MLSTIVRWIWTLVAVCLVAVTGVQPLRAGEVRYHDTQPQLGDRRPVLPLVTAPRAGMLVAATRPSGPQPRLPLAVLPAPPALPRIAASMLAEVSYGWEPRGPAQVPARCARGPPEG